MAFFFTVMSNILTTIDFVGLFSDLGAKNAQASITLDDLARIIRTENATFFRELEVTDLRSTHNQFYWVWLPTITARTTITPNDVESPNGALYYTFQHIRNAISITTRNLDRLESIYRNYSTYFHIDDVVQGTVLFGEMYALLLQMHSAYATLHRIKINAASLDDPRLLDDTLAARYYLYRGVAVITWVCEEARRRRFMLDVFTPTTGNTLPMPWGEMVYQWWWHDRYQNLRTTPERYQLNVTYLPTYFGEEVYPLNPEMSAQLYRKAEGYREQRRQAVMKRFNDAIGGDYNEVARIMQAFDFNQLALREIRQRRGIRVEGLSVASFIEKKLATFTLPTERVVSSNEKPKRDPDTEKEAWLVPPVDADEYSALSEYLFVTTTGKESLAGEAEADVKAADSRDAAHTCPRCHSVMVLKAPTAQDLTVDA